jgi:hypothetical protein
MTLVALTGVVAYVAIVGALLLTFRINPQENEMRVAKGRMVTFRGYFSNGETEHPAMITRDWSGNNADPINAPVCVNLTVFPDGGAPVPFSSVLMYDSRQAANTAGSSQCCFWPDIL